MQGPRSGEARGACAWDVEVAKYSWQGLGRGDCRPQTMSPASGGSSGPLGRVGSAGSSPKAVPWAQGLRLPQAQQ